jgi:hypothetical protein
MLKAARRRRDQARERLADAFRYRAGQNLIQQRREDVRKAEQAIPLIEAEVESRKDEILQLRRAYW